MPSTKHSVKHFRTDRVVFSHHTAHKTDDVEFHTSNNFDFKNKTKHTAIENAGVLTQTGASNFAGTATHNGATQFNDHTTLIENRELRFHNSNAKIYNEGTDGNLTAWAGNRVRIEANGADLELKSNVSDVVLMSNRDVRFLANDGNEFLKCSKATDNIIYSKPSKFNGVVSLDAETTSNAQFNQNENLHMASGKDIRFGSGGTCLINRTGNDVNVHQNVVGGKLKLYGDNVEISTASGSTTIDANIDTILKASSGEEYLKCSHSTGGITISKETTCNAQFNQTENLHLTSGKELRFGGGGTNKMYRSGNDLHIVNSVAGASLNLECVSVNVKGTTALNVVETPTIFTSPAVVNLADDGSIPITSTLVNIDANGGARTGIRFAGTGTVGQMIIVQNSGAEKLTFHNTEGTSLVKAIHANHDTLEPASVYMFVSTGALWCIIGGGKGSGTQLVAS